MRIKKINTKKSVGLKLKQHKSKYELPTEETDIRLPCLTVFCASRGGGKTYSCVALCSHFERKRYITRTFLISPTRESNDIFKNLTTLKEDDCCDNEQNYQLALTQITARVQADWEEYEEQLQYHKIFNKHRAKRERLTLKEEKILEENNYSQPITPKRPGHMLIVDDMQGSDIYSNHKKNDLMKQISIKHRHLPLSICFLVQSWSGLPRVLRLNATHFAIYKTNDKKQLMQIWENFGNLVEYERFLEMYQHAVSTPHGFLFIDTVPKQEQFRFRNGFNEYFDAEEDTNNDDDEEDEQDEDSEEDEVMNINIEA